MKTKHAKKTATHKKRDALPASPAAHADHKENKKQAQVLEKVLSEVTAQPEVRHLEEWVQVPCPYCGEEFEIHVTSEDDGQTMYEDCEVCCRPISLHIVTEEGELQVEAYRS